MRVCTAAGVFALLACGGDQRAPPAAFAQRPSADAAVDETTGGCRATPAGCRAGDDAAIPYVRDWRPGDGGPSDGGMSGCGTGGWDAAVCPRDAGPSGLRPAVPATFGADDLGKPACVRFDEPAPWQPQLFATDGKLYVIDTDPMADVPPLRVRVAATGLSFGAPTTLLYGARRADLMQEGDKFRLLAARQFYAVAFESTDGVDWIEGQHVAPDEPTYNCEGFPPLAFFRGRTPARLLAMGNDYNSGVFGCSDRVFLSRRGSGSWDTPTQIGQGDVMFALDGERRQIVLTTLGALVSEDDGKNFARQPEVGGSGAAWTGARLVVADVHDGSSAGGVVVVFSDDEAKSWQAPVVLLAEPVVAAPLIAADGATLAVAVALSDALVLTRSTDAGATWSKPRRLDRPADTRLDAVAVDGQRIAWLTTGGHYEVCAVQ